MHICEQSVSNYSNVRFVKWRKCGIECSLRFHEIFQLGSIVRFWITGEVNIKEMIPVVNPHFRRLIFLINNNTIGSNNNEDSIIFEIIECVMYFFILNLKLVNRNQCIILIKNKIMYVFLFNNVLNLTDMINHSSGPEEIIMKDQVIGYFQHIYRVTKIYNYYNLI